MDDSLRRKYVDRLRDICQKGLYMKPGAEKIYGINNTMIQTTIARICFTEIKLSQAEEQAKRYGDLGIGFGRDFVLEREGNPVFYVQNGDKGHVIENFSFLHRFVAPNEERRKELEIILGYLKNMSEMNDGGLKYYEEMEWRVVHLEKFEGRYIAVEDKLNHIYRLTLKPEDIKII